jgi:hypothetical protein
MHKPLKGKNIKACPRLAGPLSNGCMRLQELGSKEIKKITLDVSPCLSFSLSEISRERATTPRPEQQFTKYK